MVDHAAQFGGRNSAAQLDRVPVLLIHVIAGLDFLVTIAQIERALRIAFQVHPRWNVIERSEGEDLSANFENEDILTEGRAFSYVQLHQAIFTKVFQVHR